MNDNGLQRDSKWQGLDSLGEFAALHISALVFQSNKGFELSMTLYGSAGPTQC